MSWQPVNQSYYEGVAAYSLVLGHDTVTTATVRVSLEPTDIGSNAIPEADAETILNEVKTLLEGGDFTTAAGPSRLVQLHQDYTAP